MRCVKSMFYFLTNNTTLKNRITIWVIAIGVGVSTMVSAKTPLIERIKAKDCKGAQQIIATAPEGGAAYSSDNSIDFSSDDDGKTPLMWAIESEICSKVKRLLL